MGNREEREWGGEEEYRIRIVENGERRGRRGRQGGREGQELKGGSGKRRRGGKERSNSHQETVAY